NAGPLEFGTKYHTIAEQYLTNGGTPDQSCAQGRLFTECVPLLPKPGTVDVERHVEVEYRGHTFHGYLDFSRKRDRLNLALAGDHKTCSGPQWALTAETLPDDEQGIMYPWLLFQAGDAKGECELHWQYADKKTRRALPPVKLTVTEE